MIQQVGLGGEMVILIWKTRTKATIQCKTLYSRHAQNTKDHSLTLRYTRDMTSRSQIFLCGLYFRNCARKRRISNSFLFRSHAVDSLSFSPMSTFAWRDKRQEQCLLLWTCWFPIPAPQSPRWASATGGPLPVPVEPYGKSTFLSR